MKSTILVVFAVMCCNLVAKAQSDTMFVMKNDIVVQTLILNNSNVDSIIFYNPHKKTMLDIDGNRYKTVIIGTQTWMAENLKVTHYRNGDPITNLQDSALWVNTLAGAYCAYNNSAENFKTYGALYNWFTVNDPRNIAPKGWHVPSISEMNILIAFLGGEAIAGDKMKEAGNTNWITSSASTPTNSSGFTALPSGIRIMDYLPGTDATFVNLQYQVSYWTTDFNLLNSEKVYSYMLTFNVSSFKKFSNGAQRGFSVRCVKD